MCETSLVQYDRSRSLYFQPVFGSRREALVWFGLPADDELLENVLEYSIHARRRGHRIGFLWERTGHEDPLNGRADLYDQLYSAADVVFVLNLDDLALLRSHGIGGKTTLIGTAVDTRHEFLPADAMGRAAARSALGISTDAVVALFLGRLVPRKGAGTLAQIWHDSVAGRSPRGVLLVVGSGYDRPDSEEEELKDRASRVPTIRFVHHDLHHSRLPYYYSADFYVSLASHEGEPAALVEAMACGLPAVVTDIAGHRRLVVNGRTGYLVQVGDHLAMGQSLTQLMTDDAIRHSMARSARAYVVRRRDIRILARRFLRAILADRGESLGDAIN
jgi:glycosyltransferase involved in cell wall biosynthesis